MLDIIIKGGRVVTPWGVGGYDIGIQGEKIVAVAAASAIGAEAGRVIDATGKIVIPGGIEPHAHVASKVFVQPGAETAPPDKVSRAAVFGGTTTICDFATQHPGIDIPQAIEERETRWRQNSYCDYAYHCQLFGAPSDKILSQITSAIAAGFPTVKVFTTKIRPPRVPPEPPRMMDMGSLSAIMEKVAVGGGIMMVHAEDDDLVMFKHQQLKAQDRYQWYNMHLAHNNMSEDLSFRRVINGAKWTGAAVYFVHISTKEGLEAVQEARSDGLPIYGETLHHYVSFTSDDYQKPDGMKYHTYPSLKSEKDRLALWQALLGRSLHCVGTDEYCTSLEIKLKGRTIEDVTGGHNGVETRVGIIHSEGVVQRGMPLERFVDLVSTNAARLMGLYPQKGVIAPGSDADIVFIDPDFRKRLTMDDLHASDYSIWEGWEVSGWPVFTMIRGRVVVEDRKLTGTLGYGKLIKRRVSQEIINRPAI